MSALSIRLPDSLHHRARELARRERVSINQLVASAVGEKIAALDAADYLESRAARATRARFRRALARVPDAAPEPKDQRDSGALRE
ncbi:MAG: toxin-antitoxin system HicB family antitoxin [Planctomycetes bacterium]|nr:toxin-antitoxin system HicB family antitoxin [Planctomycetota bacterium]